MKGLGHHFGGQNGGSGASFWGSGASFWNHFGGLGGFWLPNAILGRLGGRLGGQHGPNLAPKTEPKSNKNRSKNRSKFWCLLGSDFWRILVDFGSKMEACWPPKSHLKWSSQKMWKIAFGASPLVPNGVHSFQVGSKNRSKIDQKSLSTWEALLASIFHGFWSILEAKMDPSWEGNSKKNRS